MMIKKPLLLLTLLCLTACTEVQIAETALNKVVYIYCKANKHVRETNRFLINTALAPNKIQITCVGDG